MRLSKRWARIAAAGAIGAFALGVGTVAAQSASEPWWWDAFQAGGDVNQSLVGEVRIVKNTEAGDIMSGNLGRARRDFPVTGEYIGCHIMTNPDDGQFITCAAKDTLGTVLACKLQFEPGEFELRQHMMLNAALNLTDSNYVAITVDPSTGECISLEVIASSADFLAPREPLSMCTESNSIDLGSFGGSPITVPGNACVKVTKFAKPNWKYGPNRTMQLQNPTATAYPVPLEYKQACTGAKGTGQFDFHYDNQYLPGLSDACTLFIKLKGKSNQTIALRYW